MTSKIAGHKLCLGDVVSLSDSPYSTATVKKVGDTYITFFRPYVSTADFSYAGGVICYIGLEEFDASNAQTYDLIERRKSPLA
jgi:hypothetical protein